MVRHCHADCARYRQSNFTESYLTHQRSHVFASVAVLIFVFDVETREFNADLVRYVSIITALRENSPNARIFVLIHKMDLISMEERQVRLDQMSAQIRQVSVENDFGGDRKGAGPEVEFWGTSIWDQSLYKAWTRVIYHLVPNSSALENLLNQLLDITQAHELIVYERRTCLMVTHVNRPYEQDNPSTDRFEKLSSILKSQKASIAKHTRSNATSANFAELQIKSAKYMFLITRLTENTNLAVALPPGEALFNAARVNIALARAQFAEFDITGSTKTDKKPITYDSRAFND